MGQLRSSLADYAVIDIENFTEPSGDQAQEVLTDGSDSLLVASSLSKRHDGYVKQRMSWGGKGGNEKVMVRRKDLRTSFQVEEGSRVI